MPLGGMFADPEEEGREYRRVHPYSELEQRNVRLSSLLGEAIRSLEKAARGELTGPELTKEINRLMIVMAGVD